MAAIAASLVNARRTLDASTATLGRVYAADETLSSLPVPSFTLAEADFERSDVAPALLAQEPRPLRLWTIPWKPPPSTKVASSPTVTSATGALKVRVTLRRMDIPLGLVRIERLLADGYVESVEEPD